jgi:pterin-4a-carbinolamine dehydratase
MQLTKKVKEELKEKHCDVTLWTHAARGLSENDFILASKLDAIV